MFQYIERSMSFGEYYRMLERLVAEGKKHDRRWRPRPLRREGKPQKESLAKN